MKKASLFYCAFLFVFLTACSDRNENDQEFNAILNSLSKNYVNQGPYDRFTTTCWKVDEATFKKDSLDYIKGLDIFHKQELAFIRFLLNTKEETNEYGNWIQSRNLCSSVIHESDFTNNKKGTIILIDNLFCHKGNPIVINKYVDRIKIDNLNQIILEEGKNKDFNAIKKAYLNYVNTLK